MSRAKTGDGAAARTRQRVGTWADVEQAARNNADGNTRTAACVAGGGDAARLRLRRPWVRSSRPAEPAACEAEGNRPTSIAQPNAAHGSENVTTEQG